MATTPMETPNIATSPPQTHILITGASSGLGRAFFEHYAAFPPTTHHVRGIDASPWPSHARVSSYAVGACGHFTQVDLTAEALVQKFIRAATIPAGAAVSRSSAAASASAAAYAAPAASTTTTTTSGSSGTPSRTSSNSTTSTSSNPTTPPSTQQWQSLAQTRHSNPPTPTDEFPPSQPQKPTPYAAPFTLVIHCAGIRGLAQTPSHADPAAAAANPSARETIAAMDAATMRRAYESNTVATFSLIKALLPSIRGGNTSPSRRPKIVIMASRMGSITLNTSLGGAYAYRASKAALNAVVRSLRLDVPEAVFALVHPGRVETTVGLACGLQEEEEGERGKVVGVAEVVRDVLELIPRLGVEGEAWGLESGCFVDRWGEGIPW